LFGIHPAFHHVLQESTGEAESCIRNEMHQILHSKGSRLGGNPSSDLKDTGRHRCQMLELFAFFASEGSSKNLLNALYMICR
jgi:hypothetical protein